MGNAIKSWGGLESNSFSIGTPFWSSDLKLPTHTYLPVGLMRSYGDSCLVDGFAHVMSSNLKSIFSFDTGTGLIHCAGGLSIGELIDFALPHGFFVPVSPGTKHVTMAGAVANDIHGKNHHRAGTFGRFVSEITLVRSDLGEVICSPDINQELYAATIGGLGLTGFIKALKIKLKPIPGGYIENETMRYNSLNEYFEISQDSKQDYEYTVAWMDVSSKNADSLGGIYIRGNHSSKPGIPKLGMKLSIPMDLPSFTLNPMTIKIFNSIYKNKQISQIKKNIISYEPFFYPLDGVENWNRIYGPAGFYQFQCVVPLEPNHAGVRIIIDQVLQSGKASFLTVLKDFGSLKSPGILSFPTEGTTLCFDFKRDGSEGLSLLKKLEDQTVRLGGRMYPAKDATMSGESFKRFFPRWEEFSDLLDPIISSAFWERVSKH